MAILLFFCVKAPPKGIEIHIADGVIFKKRIALVLDSQKSGSFFTRSKTRQRQMTMGTLYRRMHITMKVVRVPI